ncbi:MAG TPA: HEAT repeat domain-containing protein, partial [Nitrospirota bacterium]
VREYALSGYDNMIEAGLVNCSLPKVLSIVSTDKNSVATRVKAVRIIARIPGEETGNELLRLIQKETNPAILTEVLYQSGENATGEMIYPALEILVSDQDPEVKAAAVYLLRKLEANEAYPHILNLAKDGKLTNENLMLESFAALSKIGKKGDATHFLTYLNREVIGCPDCYNYKDTLLDLIENCSPPGNKESIAALEKFRLKASARMAEKVDKALSSLKRATQVN